MLLVLQDEDETLSAEKLGSLVDTVLKVAYDLQKNPDKFGLKTTANTNAITTDFISRENKQDNSEYVLLEDRQHFDKLLREFQIYGEPAKAKFREEYNTYLKMFIRLQRVRRLLDEMPNIRSELSDQFDTGFSQSFPFHQFSATDPTSDTFSDHVSLKKKRSRWSPVDNCVPVNFNSVGNQENITSTSINQNVVPLWSSQNNENNTTMTSNDAACIQNNFLSQPDGPGILAKVLNNLRVLPKGYPFNPEIKLRFNITFNVLYKGIAGDSVNYLPRSVPCCLNFKENNTFVTHDLRNDDEVIQMENGYKTSEKWNVKEKPKFRFYRRRMKVQFQLGGQNIDFGVWTIVNEDESTSRDVVLGLDFVRRWVTQINFTESSITLYDQITNTSCRCQFESIDPAYKSAYNMYKMRRNRKNRRGALNNVRGRGRRDPGIQRMSGDSMMNNKVGFNPIPGLGFGRGNSQRTRGIFTAPQNY